MWDEALECPHLNPLPEGEDVFSVALISHISHFINTWLKRGAWPGLLPTLNRASNTQRPTSNSEAQISDQKINPIQGE